MIKPPTIVSLVEAELRGAGDFMSVQMLISRTGAHSNQVTAALFSLRGFRVADVVIEKDGTGWWFALPPEQDTRCHKQSGRAPEVRPRKRKSKGTSCPP